jgi:hypothetical protein
MAEVYDMPERSKREYEFEDTPRAPLGVTQNTKRRQRASGTDRVVATLLVILFIVAVMMILL